MLLKEEGMLLPSGSDIFLKLKTFDMFSAFCSE